MASRMFAIANVPDGLSREDAARHAGMERQCLRDWVNRFHAEGVAGLEDLPRKGCPRRMHEGIEKAFCERVDEGPDADTDKLVRWRRVNLQEWLKSEYIRAVRSSSSSLG